MLGEGDGKKVKIYSVSSCKLSYPKFPYTPNTESRKPLNTIFVDIVYFLEVGQLKYLWQVGI